MSESRLSFFSSTLVRSLMLLSIIIPLLFISGCAHTSVGGQQKSSDDMETHPEPYYPSEFKDLLIPHELAWDRGNSIVVSTESYAGGVLAFTGRVEVNSLTDFFINSMRNNNWRLVGSVKQRNILLAFTKPHKTCTIMINDRDFSQRTVVNIYITEDISAREKSEQRLPASDSPFDF